MSPHLDGLHAATLGPFTVAHLACALHLQASWAVRKISFISSFAKSICTAQVQGWTLKIETLFCVMWHSGNPLTSLPHVQINEMVICPFSVAFPWLL